MARRHRCRLGQPSSTLQRLCDLLSQALTPGWRALSCPQSLVPIYFALHLVLARAFLLGSTLCPLTKMERPVGSGDGEEGSAPHRTLGWLFKYVCAPLLLVILQKSPILCYPLTPTTALFNTPFSNSPFTPTSAPPPLQISHCPAWSLPAV